MLWQIMEEMTLYFSNHIQLGIFPTVENAVRFLGLISSKIKNMSFQRSQQYSPTFGITQIQQNIWTWVWS